MPTLHSTGTYKKILCTITTSSILVFSTVYVLSLHALLWCHLEIIIIAE